MMNYSDIPLFDEYSKLRGEKRVRIFVTQLFKLGHDIDDIETLIRSAKRDYLVYLRKQQ